jgi:hypothetical protein
MRLPDWLTSFKGPNREWLAFNFGVAFGFIPGFLLGAWSVARLFGL